MGLSSWKLQDNAWLLLKIFLAIVILRMISLLAGYTGYIPLIDEACDLILRFFDAVAGGGRFFPRIKF